SANAAVGVAMANRFPQITLSAQVGSSASDMNKLFSPTNGFWTLAGGALAPIFDAGILASKQVAAEESYNQSLAQYRSTVLTAFQNVADTLRALQADERMIEAARTAMESANRSLSLVRKQVEGGQVSLPALLTAQQAYLQTSLAKVQADASRAANVFALLQALGRPWWPAPDNQPKIVTQAQAVE
ncbi:MAG: RND transporter, partial [Betaproteobacteria bacterium]|nr:RND transporter [Betaproteobacteria bacterium]